MFRFEPVRRFSLGLVLAGLVVSASGCIWILIGSAAALGGYAVSPDTIEGVVSGHDFDETWDAATEIVAIMGLVEERNEAGGVLIAKIQGARVTITIVSMSQNAVKLAVKARKLLLPRINVAQDIYVKIVSYLKE